MQIEKRGFAGERVEVRENDDGTVTVAGYAAVFNEEADIAGIFREVIRPGAFRTAITRGDDVTFNWDHNDRYLFARTSSGTLKIYEDERGLRMESILDASDPDVRGIVPKMKRGDLSKMSFAFSMDGGTQHWASSGDMELREIIEVGALRDVSIVAHPAYEGTSIAMRSRDKAKEESEAEKNRREAAKRIAERKAESENKFRRI